MRSQLLKYPFLTVLLFVNTVSGQQTEHGSDTLFYQLKNPVVITATRFALTAQTAPTSVHIINRNEIEMMVGSSLADIANLSSGSVMSQYGSSGSVQLLSFRGLSPEYTIIRLNGVRLNDMQSGIVDLGRMSVSNIDRVEISPGGYGALYGNGALGGVINIATQTHPTSSKGINTRISLSSGLGSFGWNQQEIHASASHSMGHISASFESERARNNFSFLPIHDVNKKPVLRSNSDFNRRNVSLDASLLLQSSSLWFNTNLSQSDVGVPGAYTSSEQGLARQSDQDVRFIFSWKKIISTESFLEATAAYLSSDERYDDPQINFNGIKLQSEYRNETPSFIIQYENQPRSDLRLHVGTELMQTRLHSNDLVGTPKRNQISAFVSGEYKIPLNNDSASVRVLRLFPSSRFEYIHDISSGKEFVIVVPAFGFNLSLITDNLFLRGRVTNNFRLPTFNQLYWKQGGNPNLNSEYSTALEIGIAANTAANGQSIEVNYFYHDIKNKIVWMPGSVIYWVPKNIQHVVSQGVESTVKLNFINSMLSIILNGQHLNSIKMNRSFDGDITEGKFLPYIPRLSGNAVISLRIKNFNFTLTEQVIGKRYTDEINSESSALPAHAITNAAIQIHYQFGDIQAALKFECGNLFNQNYEMIAFYPMPPRWIHARLSITYQ